MALLGETLNAPEQRPGIGDQGSEEVASVRDKGNPAIHALFVYNSNPAAVAPNQNSVRRGLLRPDLFTVVHDLFLTDTADYADYLLPATTFLEHTDIQGAYGHYFVQLSRQAIAPPGEARSNVRLFGELAQRMGFREQCFHDTAEEIIAQALALDPDGRSTNPGMEHITLEELRTQGRQPVQAHLDPRANPFLPFSDAPNSTGTPATPTGKIEFFSETLAAQGLDGLPSFVPPQESRWGKSAARFPLEFLSRKADNYMNSTFAHLEGHRKMEAATGGRLEIHPQDALTRGIADGDPVRIWNDRGELQLRALVGRSVPPGVVAARMDWARLSPGGVNVNALTSEQLTDLGAAPTFYSVLVEVARQ
jgi:anaerobic selenocysteine-containing dehydrogenase